MEPKHTSKTALHGCQQTRLALLWLNLSSEPLVSLYTFLPFILCKDLNVSTFQLSLFITLRPVLSVFSFYWSAYRGHKLVASVVGACLLAYLPFLFFPCLGNIWYLLAASAIYQLFSRAGIPSLIEILKRNIPKQPREHAFSLFFLLSFIESGVLGLIFGSLLDTHGIDWRWLFSGAAVVGLSALLLFRKIAVQGQNSDAVFSKTSLLHPWQESMQLLRERADFAQFQWIFMIGGASLMLMSPAFSRYYAQTLLLSHTDMAMARFVFMALGVAVASYFWRKSLNKIPVLQLTLWILFGFGLFPLILLLAQFHFSFLYLAFLVYGIAQAGSHLLWYLSGTLFCAERDSTPFSRVNLLMIGLRGACFPLIGGFLCDLCGQVAILYMGMSICFIGALFMRRKIKKSLFNVGYTD